MMTAEQSLILPAAPDLLWGTVSFVVVALVMYRLAWPAFMTVLAERRTRIEEGLNAAAKAKEEVAQERASLQGEVDEARREAARIREQAHTNAAEIVADARRQATVEAKRVTETAQRQIAAEKQSTEQALRSDVGGLAADLAARIVGIQALDSTVSQNVVDRFLDELESADSGASSSKEG